MGACQYSLVSFLLLLVGTHASFDPSKFDIKSTSTLEEVDEMLKALRNENLDMELFEFKNKALDMLKDAGYFEDDLWSKVDKAIEKGCYTFLKIIYPNTTTRWRNEDSSLFLARAIGRTDWMDEKEWGERSKGIDWGLRFRDLIRSKNENAYKKFRDLIFKNPLFKEHFREIIQDAYDSGNTAFLRAVPYPSKESPFEVDDAVFFWSLAYGQEWCPKGWDDYIGKKTPDSVLEKLDISESDNPRIFECKRVMRFLKKDEYFEKRSPLETAIIFDSLALAQHFKDKCEGEEFKSAIKRYDGFFTGRRTLMGYPGQVYNRVDKAIVSRVYNFFLKNGRKLDPSYFNFDYVPLLDKGYLQLLLNLGFNKKPSVDSDLELYCTTETGIEFLKMILKGKYVVDGTPLKLTLEQLRFIRPKILDLEVFKLIDERLASVSKEGLPIPTQCIIRRESRKRWVRLAVQKGDIKFLTDAGILSSDFPSIAAAAFEEAAKGNLAVLDWIFEEKRECLEDFDWRYRQRYDSSPYVPLLRYLFEKSRSYHFLAHFTREHIWRAIHSKNEDHYDQVRAIDGADEAMTRDGMEIRAFPGREEVGGGIDGC